MSKTEHTPGPPSEWLKAWSDKRMVPQIILKKDGHSWLGFHTLNEKFNNQLQSLLNGWPNGENEYFILNHEGDIKATAAPLHEVLKYVNSESVLVHRKKGFIPNLGYSESAIDTIVSIHDRMRKGDEYCELIWDKFTQSRTEISKLQEDQANLLHERDELKKQLSSLKASRPKGTKQLESLNSELLEALKRAKSYIQKEDEILKDLANTMAGRGENCTTKLADQLIIEGLEIAIAKCEGRAGI